MASIKKIYIISIAIMILASVILCLPFHLYAEDIPNSSNFMDKKSSIELLYLKVKRVRRSIVTIVVYDSAGVVKSGSGVFIDTEGRIITNASILENAYSAEVFSETTHYKKVAMLNPSKSSDIALLQVNATNEIPLELDYEFKINIGERVVVIGKTSALRTTVSEGLVSNVINIGEASGFFEIETVKGLLKYKYSENGPVINMGGEVIGITVLDVAGLGDELFPKDYYGEKLNAVSVRSIKALVGGPYNIEHLHPVGTRVWHRWIVRKIKTMTTSLFVNLYNLGFIKILAFMFAFVLIIALIQKYYYKFKKKYTGK